MKHRRERTFSDMSIAESCIDLHEKQEKLMKRQPAIGLLDQITIKKRLHEISEQFGNVQTDNILQVTQHLYHIFREKFSIYDMKTIIVELLSEAIDNNTNNDHNYSLIYRPILKDIIPSFIDICNTQKKKKSKWPFLKK